MADDSTIDEALQQIQQLRGLDQLEAAETACRTLLDRAPREPRAWFTLGLVQLKRGAKSDGIESLNQGATFASSPQQQALYRHTRSAALRDAGKLNDAVAEARLAVKLDGSEPAYWHNLADALFQSRHWNEAAQACREALKRDPQNAAAWHTLGASEYYLDHPLPSQKAYEQSLAIAPARLDVWVEYAHVLSKLGDPHRALEILRDVLRRDAKMLSAWLEFALAHVVQSQWDQAATAYRRALELAPAHREISGNLFNALLQKGAPAEAEALARQLIAGDSQRADATVKRGAALQAQGRTDEAIGVLKRGLAMEPNAAHHSRLLAGLQYAEGSSAQSLFEKHKQWADAYAQARGPAPPKKPKRGANEALRLGFVSTDFGRHPIGFLALPALEALDKSRCSIVCYSDALGEDDFTQRFRAASAQWRQTADLSDDELADLIRQDEIDILFDLMGHFGKRLPLFAQKPAPLQVTWLGYVGTTGLPAIDYLLADRFHVPVGEEQWYAETVLRLPNDYACYAPPPDAPPVAPLPAAATGRLTFGCFNNPAKYSASLLDAWAAILRQAPDAQLLLKARGLGEPATQSRLRQQLAQRGVKEHQVVLEGWSPQPELMASYNRVDLALDTQPYSGGLTTCEALWMGVPVITCAGKTFAGRHSVSHLTNAGYERFIAADLAAYVELAVQWSRRVDELASLRQQTREQVRRSPLCDAQGFARDFLNALGEISKARMGAAPGE